MVGRTFLLRSPRVYTTIPQLTEQYGQVLRDSVVRVSLYSRAAATASLGENPIAAKLEPTRPAALALKNCLRFISIVKYLLEHCSCKKDPYQSSAKPGRCGSPNE